jgi:hypothetical protein
MNFILSISDALSQSTLPFNEKCSIELNGDEISTNYDFFQKKARLSTNKIWKTGTNMLRKVAKLTGYCVHARLYLRDKNRTIQLKDSKPSPLSFVYCKDRFSAFKVKINYNQILKSHQDGQLKFRLRENLTMKHLPVSDKTPPELLIQFSLTYQGEKLLETELCPISFTPTKKKKYAETTDIIISPKYDTSFLRLSLIN